MRRQLIPLLMLLFLLQPLPAQAAPSPTGYEILPVFRSFYDRFGGLPTFGYPLSGPIFENGRLVQYFERQRFEFHPELQGTDFEVLLGHLGREIAAREGRDTSPTTPKPGHRFFPETGHNLAPQFLTYWETRGGLRLFGYPITEPVWDNGLLIQYTERARFEFHPDKAGTPWAVLLGRLGADLWASRQFAFAATESDTRLATDLLARLNAARQQHGLTPLTRNPILDALASFRSTDMATHNYFSHTAPDGSTVFSYLPATGLPWRAAGETLQRNNFPTPQAAAEAARSLLASPSHRAILLDPRFSHVGIACVTDPRGMHYFTVIVIQQA